MQLDVHTQIWRVNEFEIYNEFELYNESAHLNIN